MDPKFNFMNAASSIAWSEIDAHDHLMDTASIFTKSLEFQNELGRSFDERWYPFIKTYGVQYAFTLLFEIY